MAIFLFFVMLCVLVAGLVLLVRGTVKKSKWGINIQAVACPRCHAALPQIRKPTSFKQAMWGGSSCQSCGAELDKWGREIGRG
ncbi:hypothetical protein [Edaphobacter flagellatus]|uniref:hypothetical protein n=1 Tax=Edaphobacter flagellatus TaxID=1933044 RepID=UPI0021B21C54|nr:hypothetical protein [Edaphobacter flagellatus]